MTKSNVLFKGDITPKFIRFGTPSISDSIKPYESKQFPNKVILSQLSKTQQDYLKIGLISDIILVELCFNLYSHEVEILFEFDDLGKSYHLPIDYISEIISRVLRIDVIFKVSSIEVGIKHIDELTKTLCY